MAKKQPIRIRMKPLITALREGKKTWSDLSKLDIPDKTLERILKDYLQYWGLAQKRGDYWVWYEHLRVFDSGREYGLAVEHSRKLLPEFQQILLEGRIYDPTLHSAAKEHLKSYPEIYHKLEEFEKGLADFNKKLLQNEKLLQDLYNPDRRGPFGFIPFYENLDPTRPREEDIKEKLGGKELKALLEIYRELSGHISLLSLKIENGQPLEGICPLCPRVKIMNG